MKDELTTKTNEMQLDRIRILGIPAILMALLFSVTWIGAVLAYGWGFFDLGSKTLNSPSSWGIAPHIIAAFVVIAILPVAFIWMTVITLGRAAAMTRAASDLARAARRLTNPVTYLGDGARTVIAELDQEFNRLKTEVSTIDQMLAETHERISAQVSLLKGAGEEAGQQATQLQQHLGAERQALQELARMIGHEGERISSLLDTASPETGSGLTLGVPLSGHNTNKASNKDHSEISDAAFNLQDAPQDKDEEPLDLPKKLSPLEELSNYIGQHQAARQEKAIDVPDKLKLGEGNVSLDIPLLATPSLNVNIEDTAEMKSDLEVTSQPVDLPELEPALDEPENEETETEEQRDAVSDQTRDTPPSQDTPPRNSLSLSRRLDRARLPVDLRTNIDGLHALSIDLNRLLSTSPPADLWRRYMNGEREVFTEHLLVWKETAEESDIETTAASETFQRYAQRFREQFEETIKLARTSEAGSSAVSEINNSDISSVNDLLLDLDRRTA